MRDETGFRAMGMAAAHRCGRDTYQTVGEQCENPNPLAHQANRVPRWVDCDAEEFEQVWLPKFKSGIMPACSDEEWTKIKAKFHSDETPAE